jgi:hypothetical protein
VAEEVEHPLCKCKALSSNPQSHQKKKNYCILSMSRVHECKQVGNGRISPGIIGKGSRGSKCVFWLSFQEVTVEQKFYDSVGIVKLLPLVWFSRTRKMGPKDNERKMFPDKPRRWTMTK